MVKDRPHIDFKSTDFKSHEYHYDHFCNSVGHGVKKTVREGFCYMILPSKGFILG